VSGKAQNRPVGVALGAIPDPMSLEPAGAEATSIRFARAMLARDPRAAAACFSPAGCILTADGTAVAGRREVVTVLQQIAASVQQLEIRIGRTILGPDHALCTQFWRRSGGSHQTSSTARLVLRRASSWEIVIASPWE
jgi:hypothetical protein